MLAMPLLPLSIITATTMFCCAGCDRNNRRAAQDSSAIPADLSDRLERHVRYLAGLSPPRSYRHPDSQARVAEYIADHFRRAGLAVSFQTYTARNISFRNVIGMMGRPDRPRLVIGAHYDVCGEMPGADDNASGVAGLIETAYLLADKDLPITVEFVSYPCEEPPFYGSKNMGSYRHAFALKQAGVNVVAMICYEMIGYFCDEPSSQRYPPGLFQQAYPSTGNYIGVAGRTADKALVLAVANTMKQATDLPVEHIAAPSLLYMIGLSDHRNYWKAGYTAVMICDTSFYRNPHYHEPADTPETLDYRRMAKVVLAASVAIEKLAWDQRSAIQAP